MGQPAEDRDAMGEAVAFLGHFKDLPDPRQLAKITYPLEEVLLLCLLAVLAGAEGFCDIARFGETKGDILAALDPEAFQRCFIAWVSAVTGIAAEVIAIDGKTSRRSHDRKSGKSAIHMVAPFAAP